MSKTTNTVYRWVMVALFTWLCVFILALIQYHKDAAARSPEEEYLRAEKCVEKCAGGPAMWVNDGKECECLN